MPHQAIRTVALLLALLLPPAAQAAKFEQTPYGEQKVVFDFYFDEPTKAAAALFWIRALMQPLLEEPYGHAPEFLDIKVVIHGTEIVTLARHNYGKYKDIVDRMRYYASLGVDFRVCGLAAEDYGYRPADLQEFVKVVPSAITELAHWQLQGYALITPQVLPKKHAVEDIR
jgi:intracellular sulfur oxidation DsrE/DsrF family protein